MASSTITETSFKNTSTQIGAFTEGTANYTNAQPTGASKYYKRNGMCHVVLFVNCVSPSSSNVWTGWHLAKPLEYPTPIILVADDGSGVMAGFINADGGLVLRNGTASKNYYGCITYPYKN